MHARARPGFHGDDVPGSRACTDEMKLLPNFRCVCVCVRFELAWIVGRGGGGGLSVCFHVRARTHAVDHFGAHRNQYIRECVCIVHWAAAGDKPQHLRAARPESIVCAVRAKLGCVCVRRRWRRVCHNEHPHKHTHIHKHCVHEARSQPSKQTQHSRGFPSATQTTSVARIFRFSLTIYRAWRHFYFANCAHDRCTRICVYMCGLVPQYRTHQRRKT